MPKLLAMSNTSREITWRDRNPFSICMLIVFPISLYSCLSHIQMGTHKRRKVSPGAPALILCILVCLYIYAANSFDVFGLVKAPTFVPPQHEDFYIHALVQTLEHRRMVHSSQPLIELIVNPFLPILLCDHHFGVTDLPRTTVRVNNLDVSRLGNVSPYDLVCCQTDALKSFNDTVLPHLQKPIILFTHKWNKPQVEPSDLAEGVKSHPMIAHWISQNPIYPDGDKYSAFPYGIRADNLEHYAGALLSYDRRAKDTVVKHLFVTNTHESRKILPTMPSLHPQSYYDEIKSTQFLLSPRGDRPDTYRHWEAVGLGAIPVSNINRSCFESLFGDNMLYVNNTMEMLSLLNGASARSNVYKTPDRGLVSAVYWTQRVKQIRASTIMIESQIRS
jgi:hypothetical protein